MIRRILTGLSLVLLTATGCATTGTINPVFMPELHIVYNQGQLDSYDAQTLFEQGNDYFDRGLWWESLIRYRHLLQNFPEDGFRQSTLFNSGLAWSRLAHYPQAVSLFTLAARGDDATLVRRAQWNLLDMQERTELWADALATSQALTKGSSESEQLELRGHTDILAAWLSKNNADDVLSAADRYRRLVQRDEDLYRRPDMLAHYLAGLSYADAMKPEAFSTAISFGTDASATIAEAVPLLDREASLLLKAQQHFLHAVRSADGAWAAAAVFRIGELYQRFYLGLVAIPMPSELSSIESQVYQEELADKLQPVRKKAEIAYQRILRFSRDHAVDSPWLLRARLQLEQIRQFDPMAFWNGGRQQAREPAKN